MSTQPFFTQPPPREENPLNPDGTINPVWFIWFYQLFQAAGGLADLQILQAFDAQRDNSAQAAAEDAGRLAVAIGDSPASAPLEEVKTGLAAVSDDAQDRTSADDLAKLLFSLTADVAARVVLTGKNAVRTATPAADGALFFETDTGLLFVAVAGVWVGVAGSSPGAWAAFTTTITPSAGAWTATSQDCAFLQLGKLVFVRLTVTGSLSVNAFQVNLTLPVAPINNNQNLAATATTGGSTVGSTALMNGTAIDLRKFDNSQYAAGATVLYAGGVYEAA